MKRTLVVAAMMLAAGSGAAQSLPAWLDFSSNAQEEVAPRPVVSVIVEDRGADARSLPGTVASRTQVTLGFQTLGRMISRPVDLGDPVSRGDVLAQLATEDLAASTRAARAALEAAEVQDRTTRATLERTEALAARNVASDAQLEQARQAAAAASAALQQARSQLLQAEDAEGYARLVAPFDGVISAVYEAQGAVVDAGAPIVQLSAEDLREVMIDLPETALVGLEQGALFSVWHRNEPEAEVTAVLDRIDPLADTATRTRRLYLTLPPEATFRIGALVRVRFGTAEAPSLSLPSEAVLTESETHYVWRVRRGAEAARVERVAVEAAVPFRGRVSIMSGLEAGDEVVIRGVNSLTDGQPVGRRLEQ
ncbi:efflux RND transporter periplasmic adaptor subunit [Paracoccus sp. (in: a-proteobacteria)]|uniref:efflux RND transporter periplasmic adaptor subunit n=1 Tax=Paracoccus sp. TaxID=267 RepID=UPI00396C74BE